MSKYLIFQNPNETYSGLPHASCMVYKPKKADVSGVDYIHRPRINWKHLAQVLKAKMRREFPFNLRAVKVQSVAMPNGEIINF